MNDWKRIEPTEVTKVGWRTIVGKTFQLPDGRTVQFHTVHPDGTKTTNVIAITKDKKVIVSKQYRAGPEKLMCDVPGGFVDKNESPEEAMRRELREETGYTSEEEAIFLGEYHRDSYLNVVSYAYLLTGCTVTAQQNLEEYESVKVVLFDVNEFIEMAMHDGTTDHAIVLMAYDHLQNLLKEQ